VNVGVSRYAIDRIKEPDVCFMKKEVSDVTLLYYDSYSPSRVRTLHGHI
jgi:hypothetical protein